MLEISKKTDYGIELLVGLATHFKKGPISLRQIAEERKLPYRFLGQIVGPLRKAGIVDSKEGLNGGYFLTKKPSEVSLVRIVKILEGSTGIMGCFGCAREENCQPKNIWRQLEKVLYQEMKNKTLADLT